MSALGKIPGWYWLLLAVWACAYTGASLINLNPRTPIFLTMVLLSAKPLFGLPALLALLAPILALPFALRRPKFSPEK